MFSVTIVPKVPESWTGLIESKRKEPCTIDKGYPKKVDYYTFYKLSSTG